MHFPSDLLVDISRLFYWDWLNRSPFARSQMAICALEDRTVLALAALGMYNLVRPNGYHPTIHGRFILSRFTIV